MAQVYANNLAVSLSVQASAVATSFTLQSGEGTLFPTITSPDYLKMTLAVGYPAAETSWEVVHVTNVTGDVLTVTRAQEGTSAVVWPVDTVLEARVTEGTMENILQKSDDRLTNYAEALTTIASGASPTADLSLSNAFETTLDQDATLAFSNVPATASSVVSCTIFFTQDATGSRTLTLPAAVTKGSVDLATGPNQLTIATFVTRDGGTNWVAMTSFKEV